jgi:hypothetical protein
MRSNPCADKAALRKTHGKFHGFAMNCGILLLPRCSDVAFSACGVVFGRFLSAGDFPCQE